MAGTKRPRSRNWRELHRAGGIADDDGDDLTGGAADVGPRSMSSYAARGESSNCGGGAARGGRCRARQRRRRRRPEGAVEKT